MDYEVPYIVETYKNAASHPVPESAILRPSAKENLVDIFSFWSMPDFIESETTKFSQEFLLQRKSDGFNLLSKGIPCETSMSRCAFTKSGLKFAVIRKASKKNDESTFLEIWNTSEKEKTFDMSDRKEHGKILDSGSFQSFEWSNNERYLVYTADAKKKKSESYFKDMFCQKEDTEENQKASEATVKGEEYAYQESWGESNTNAHHSVLCIFDTETGKVEVVNMDDEYPDFSAAQATWGPGDEYIIFVGFKETPYRVGLIYCSNRSSGIFSYNLESKKIERLTSEIEDSHDIDVQFPKFSPDFSLFLYTQSEAYGPHRTCRKLMKYDWKSKEISTIIDIVLNSNGEEFAGMYNTKLSSRWWSKDSQNIFFANYRRSYVEIFCVNVATKSVQRLNKNEGKQYGTWVLHDVQDPYILVSVSAPNSPPQLMIGYFTITNESGIQVAWSYVDENSESKELSDITWSIHTLPASLPNKIYPDLDYEIVVVSSKEKNNGTMIIYPHGGPHGTFNAGYFEYDVAFARLGYIVCKVNYRGSLGFGENSINSLLGNIGTQDVADVVNAVEYLKKDENLGIKQVVGAGGSHGGFIITHLLGQHPHLLKAAVARNPVVDLAVMAGTSDIPDWVWVEAGCSETFSFCDSTNTTILEEMWERSPIKNIGRIKTPTLFCLGKNDLRVPSSQGFQLYKQLRVQGVPTKVYFYDDNHALSKVPVYSDSFMQMALWFQKHLSS